MRMLIRGGTVVTATGGRRRPTCSSTARADRRPADPGSELARSWAAWPPTGSIDATGQYVLPGGIDVHTHLEMPFGGTFSADTFETGTRAAAWGGTTTIVDFAVQAKGASLRATLDTWHAKAEGNCAHRLRLPHDRLRRQRARRSRRWTSSSARA